jgi:hypothetical protein
MASENSVKVQYLWAKTEFGFEIAAGNGSKDC